MVEERVIPVLIVDDHVLVRQGIRSTLEFYADIQVVGEARDGLEAVTSVEKLLPCVVLMDVNMPRMNGIEAAAQIRDRYPDTIIIGLSVNAENQEAMKRAGAVRFISKAGIVEQLYDAIQEAVKKRIRHGSQ